MNSYNKHGGRPYLQLPRTILTIWKAFKNSFITSVLTWESLGPSISVLVLLGDFSWNSIPQHDQSDRNQLEKGLERHF